MGLLSRFMGSLTGKARRADAASGLTNGVVEAAADVQPGQLRTLVVRIAGDVRLCVPPSWNALTTYVLLEQEDWFEDEIHFVRRMLLPGMRALDIGANFGVYALTMARLVGEGGRVWAFEPGVNVLPYLRESIRRHDLPQLSLVEAGMSDASGRAYMDLQDQSEENAVVIDPAQAKHCSEIQVTSLAEAARALGMEGLDFMKMDAEGHEERIVAGGREFLQRESPLIMLEVKRSGIYDFGAMAALQALGYEPYRLLPGMQVLVPYDPDAAVDPFLLNVFCAKPDWAAALETRGLLSSDCDLVDNLLPADGAGLRWAASLPYAAGQAASWASADQAVCRMLDLFALSRDAATPVTRSAALHGAWHASRALLDAGENLERLQTHARLAWELGERRVALELTQRILMLIEQGQQVGAEPFLALSPRFESIPRDHNPDKWIAAAALENWERLIEFSSYFGGERSLEWLDQLKAIGVMTPEMERRRQLIRLRFGRIGKPDRDPLIIQRGPDNLNHEFWNALAAG